MDFLRFCCVLEHVQFIFWIVLLPKLRGILSRMGSRVDTEPKALLDPVQEAAAPAAPEVETVQATEGAHYNGKMVIYNT